MTSRHKREVPNREMDGYSYLRAQSMRSVRKYTKKKKDSLVAQRVKASTCHAGEPGSIPGSGRSPGEGNGNPLQYFCLENSMDGRAWWATVHGVAKSRTRLSDFTLLTFCPWGICNSLWILDI